MNADTDIQVWLETEQRTQPHGAHRRTGSPAGSLCHEPRPGHETTYTATMAAGKPARPGARGHAQTGNRRA